MGQCCYSGAGSSRYFFCVEVQLSDAPSIYVTGAETAPWAVCAEVEGFEVGGCLPEKYLIQHDFLEMEV